MSQEISFEVGPGIAIRVSIDLQGQAEAPGAMIAVSYKGVDVAHLIAEWWNDEIAVLGHDRDDVNDEPTYRWSASEKVLNEWVDELEARENAAQEEYRRRREMEEEDGS